MVKQKTPLATKLAATEPRVRAIYISTYPPRECGIATFTKDLTNNINLLNPSYLADIVAIDDSPENEHLYNFPWEVKNRIKQNDLKSWLNIADYINESSAEVVNLQHEFGIYGPSGTYGAFVMPFIDAIKKPVIVTFHTVLPKPSDRQREIVTHIGRKADAIVVMVDTAAKWLAEIYGVDGHKVVTIPHGVPDIPFSSTIASKKNLGLDNDLTIMGFGLLSKGKGYEQVVEALPGILQHHPNAKLLILGETHPVVAREEGEAYRNYLKKLAKQLQIEKSVIWVDRYLTLDEIVSYLQATDIYVTPYRDLNQITSGTLAYAIGAGKACISTPYPYAKEVVDENRGVIVEPNNIPQLTTAIINLLDHPDKRQKIAKNAYLYGRNMIWPSVALRYLDLFEILT